MSASNNTLSIAGQPSSNAQNSNSKAKTSKDDKSTDKDMSTLNDKLDQNFSKIAHCIDRIKAIDLKLQGEHSSLSSEQIEMLQKDKEKKLQARDGFGTQRSRLLREMEKLTEKLTITHGKNWKKKHQQKTRKLAALKRCRGKEGIEDQGQKKVDQHLEGRVNDGKEEEPEDVYETDETDSSVEFIICSPARFTYALPAMPAMPAKGSETSTNEAGLEVPDKESEKPTGAVGTEVADNE